MENHGKIYGILCLLTAAALFGLALFNRSPKEDGVQLTEMILPENLSANAVKAEPLFGEGARLSEVSRMDVMCAPNGITVMSDGTLLITDIYYKRLWKVQESASEVYAGGDTASGLYGEPLGGYDDAELLSSHFKYPWAVAPYLDGWAVSDMKNNVIRIVRNQEVKTISGNTEEELTVTDAGVVFDRPTGLASDEDGNLYVSDTGNGAVRRINPKGEVATVAEGLKEPMGLCWKDGVLYIAETEANRIVKLEDGAVVAVAGGGDEGLTDGPAEQASFAAPRGVVVGDDGAVYVADTLNSAIRRIYDGRVDTVTLRDISLADFGLISPVSLLIQDERMYICDSFARKIFVLERGDAKTDASAAHADLAGEKERV